MNNNDSVKDGLHCVYGTCRGLPNSNLSCHPGCVFTMRTIPENYDLIQQIQKRCLCKNGRILLTYSRGANNPPGNQWVACKDCEEGKQYQKMLNEEEASLARARRDNSPL